MRLGKEEAVGFVEDTLEDTALENGAVVPVEEIKVDQPVTPAPEPLRVG